MEVKTYIDDSGRTRYLLKVEIDEPIDLTSKKHPSITLTRSKQYGVWHAQPSP
jgi:hypothetical protein